LLYLEGGLGKKVVPSSSFHLSQVDDDASSDKYRLVETESEGWVISHCSSANMRPVLGAVVAATPAAADMEALFKDELPGKQEE
jgi:hypothetical protein